MSVAGVPVALWLSSRPWALGPEQSVCTLERRQLPLGLGGWTVWGLGGQCGVQVHGWGSRTATPPLCRLLTPFSCVPGNWVHLELLNPIQQAEGWENANELP